MKVRFAKYSPNPNSANGRHCIFLQLDQEVYNRLGQLNFDITFDHSCQRVTLTFNAKGRHHLYDRDEVFYSASVGAYAWMADISPDMKLGDVEFRVVDVAGSDSIQLVINLPARADRIPPRRVARGTTRERARQAELFSGEQADFTTVEEARAALKLAVSGLNQIMAEAQEIDPALQLAVDDGCALRAFVLVQREEGL